MWLTFTPFRVVTLVSTPSQQQPTGMARCTVKIARKVVAFRKSTILPKQKLVPCFFFFFLSYCNFSPTLLFCDNSKTMSSIAWQTDHIFQIPKLDFNHKAKEEDTKISTSKNTCGNKKSQA
jgi:hypothetical protein